MLSVIFFFVFTLPQCNGKQTTVTTLPQPAPVPTPAAAPLPAVAPVPTPPPTVVTPTKSFYMKSSQFLTALAERLRSAKVDEATELMAATVPQAKRDFFQKLFTASGYTPAAGSQPWREVGKISGQERWILPLTKSIQTAGSPAVQGSPQSPDVPAPTTPPEPGPLTSPSGISLTIGDPPPASPAPATPNIESPATPVTNVQPTPAPQTPAASPNAATKATEMAVDLKLSREEGFQITGLHFSPALLAAEGASSDRSLVSPPDPLSISHDFISEVLGKNFRGARSITDGTKVTHEKLAGLCIVFEEGDYQMVPGSSLNVTAATEQRAWALVRVKSPTQNVESEFGVEMAKNEGTNEWKVDSLDFSRLLQNYVQATDGGKIYYSPIVKSPSGGESLVVYFEYDKSELNARGLRQMEIVADLLKSDPARKMRLSGYTDALGAEDYNNRLSQKRAETVRTKLSELGVDPAQIISRGYGSDTPLDPNQKEDGSDNPEGRSRNRRTEIYLDF
jgi:outer membrane protein OmpA-like peptidoglycan-associated protein